MCQASLGQIVECTASRLQLETPLTSRLYLIIATSTLSASWEVKFPNQVVNLSQEPNGSRAPSAAQITLARSLSTRRLRLDIHLVIIGALGCPCSYQDPRVLAALQQPHRPSLHRPERRFSAPSVGLYCIVAPHYLFPGIWAFIPDLQLPYNSSHPRDCWIRLEGKDLACYNNNVAGSAGRLAAAAGCRERCW